MTSADKPNGYDSDQGKTQRAGQTKVSDIPATQSSGKEADRGNGQRDTDEGGTSFTRDPNDRPAARDINKKDDEKTSAPNEKRSPALSDASADNPPRSI